MLKDSTSYWFKTVIFILFPLVFSCKESSENQNAISSTNQEDRLTSITALEDNNSAEPGELVHLVFFSLKETSTMNQLFDQIEQLKKIPEVNNLNFGRYQDLEDSRALAQFDLMMSMSFQSIEDYRIYQKHPIHLELKSFAKNLLSNPPATYDYIIE